MSDAKSNRFSKYFPLLLDALRSTHPTPMRPAEARAWIRSKIEVSADDLTRRIENGKQTIFENDVHWARFYLAKAKLISSPKRLGFALVGSNDRETTRSRLRVVQFHPSLAYEDFVRGWRPAGEGRLSLVDGILMQAIEAATSEPDRPFVLVIEEINRGNPAQIFGEMLTLLEDTKRRKLQRRLSLPIEKATNAYMCPKTSM